METLFNYCPNCKSENHSFKLNKFECKDCNYIYFHNAAGAVAVFIKVKEEILFTRRNQEPKKGLLDLCGGFVDYYESAEQTIIREIKEELNLDISNCKMIYLGSNPNEYKYKLVNYHTLDLFYEIELNEKPNNLFLEESEISEVLWLKLKEVNLNEIAFESQRNFIQKMI